MAKFALKRCRGDVMEAAASSLSSILFGLTCTTDWLGRLLEEMG